ncbi:MAG: hypothetical protein ACR2LH_04185 [Thermoleophilaceae bacterium]
MRTGLVPLVGWGIALIVIALLGAIVFDLSALPTLLLAGAGAGSAVSGAWSALAGRRARRDGASVDPDVSFAAVAVVVGGSLALVGLGTGGTVFLWSGLGVVALGVGGLVRELLAERRELAVLPDGDERGVPRKSSP